MNHNLEKNVTDHENNTNEIEPELESAPDTLRCPESSPNQDKKINLEII